LVLAAVMILRGRAVLSRSQPIEAVEQVLPARLDLPWNGGDGRRETWRMDGNRMRSNSSNSPKGGQGAEAAGRDFGSGKRVIT
jgi:hypothetical protein